MLVTSTLLGQVLGPLIVGALNDALAPEFGEHAIRYSMLPGAVTPVIAGILFWFAGNSLEADTLRANAAG
jgi:hypothetical protein